MDTNSKHRQSLGHTKPLPFAIDTATGAGIPEELEILIAWILTMKRYSASSRGGFHYGGIASFAKTYYPLWMIRLGERVALLDPVVRQSYKIEYREPPSVEGFIDKLQGAHSRTSVFKNVLATYQNAFTSNGASRAVEIRGIIGKSDAMAVVDYVTRSGCNVSVDTVWEPVIGDYEYDAVAKQVSSVEAVVKTLSVGVENLKLAKSVLRTESENQLNRLELEIEAMRAEYSHEVEATREIVRQSVERLTKMRDEEIEIIASRFAEIRDLLVSDLTNLKRTHSAIVREEGYLKKMVEAGSSAHRAARSEVIRQVLGDYPDRLRVIENEESKVQYLSELVEKEKSRQLAMVKSLYDELIKAKSKIASDLQIELDTEVERRLADMKELAELRASIEEKIDSLIKLYESQFESLDWLLPNSLNIAETSPLYIPVYIAAYPKGAGEKAFVACAPGMFVSGPPPTAVGYDLEERVQPISMRFRSMIEVSLPTKIQREREAYRRTLSLVKEHDILATLPQRAAQGLKMAKEKGWVGDARAQALESMLKSIDSDGTSSSA